MQRILSVCLLALVVPPAVLADNDNANPISKVIELLSALEAKLMKDGEAEEKAFKDYFEWCDDAAREKGFSLKTDTAKKEKLESTIGKAKSDAEAASELISSLSGVISGDEADLKAAASIREKEQKDFVGEEAELASASDMLGRAISIIEREMKGSALIQTQMNVQNLNGWVQALKTLLDATSISTSDKSGLVAFVQSQQRDDDDMGELGAPAPAAYKSQSGGIVDVLTDMKEKADTELSELRKAEKNNKHNFDMLKLSITDAIKANTHELDENKAAKAEAEETLAVAEGELAMTNKALAEAQAALDLVHTDCMEKAGDHEITVKGRAEELAALAKAKKIIQQMTAGAVGQSYSFIQTSLRTRADLANMEVVNLVKKLAREQHSVALAQLASRLSAVIRYGATAGDDPFVKVKGLINDMIAKLMKEAEAEASEKAYCDEEMAKTKAKKEELTDDIEKLTSKIDSATSASERLKEEVAELQKALAELAESQAEMDKIREETHAAFVTAKADLEQGIEGVQGALEVLRNYYQADDAFLQQPAAPEKHEKSSGAGGSIINILEVAESDFTKNLAQEETEEAAAAEEYEKTTQENKINRATMEQDVKYKTHEHVSLDKAIAENTADRDGLQTELDAVLEYYDKIKERCIAKPETYEERKKRREAEIAGLKEALSILEGQAFLQRRQFRAVRLH